MGYSYDKEYDEETMVKAKGREIQVSPKHSTEICDQLREMWLPEAKELLKRVMDKEEAIPYKKHNAKTGHRKDIEGWDAGGYPVKASENILKVLENLEANAEYKGLDTDNIMLIHAAASKATEIEGYDPKAFGRTGEFNEQTTNVEFIGEER